MTEQPIRLTGPTDLADAIPHLFGYHPTESLARPLPHTGPHHRFAVGACTPLPANPTAADLTALLPHPAERHHQLNRPGFDAHLPCWEGWAHAEQVRRGDEGTGGQVGA